MSVTWTWSRLRVRNSGSAMNSRAVRITDPGNVAENIVVWIARFGRYACTCFMSG